MTQELKDKMDGISEADIKYDNICKIIFQHKEILAIILQNVVSEFQGKTTSEIMQYLNGVVFKEQSVNDTTSKSNIIKQDNVELVSVTEKKLIFDLLFTVCNPLLSSEQICINLHIDLEFQNDYRPGYPIEKRGIYYSARELGHQLNYVDENTDYSLLEKVYSIWICQNNIPKIEQNSIIEYKIEPHILKGNYELEKENYDLINMILIKLGEETDTEEGIIDFLKGVFMADIDKMEKYIGLIDESLREDVIEMKGFMSCLIEKETKKAEEKATKRALLQGKKEGIDDGAYMMKRAVSDVINGYNTVSKLISKGYPESVAKNAIQIMDFTKK